MFFLEILTFFSQLHIHSILLSSLLLLLMVSHGTKLSTLPFSDILSWNSLPSVAKVTQCMNASGGENVFQNRFHVKLVTLLHIT